MRFASLEGFWRPSGPLFVMRDVTIASTGGGEPLHLPQAAVKLDFGGLVLPSRHLINLRLRDLRLGLHRAADGRWSIDGFDAGGGTQKVSLGNVSADLWLSNLHLDIADETTHRQYGLVADQLRISMQGAITRFGGTLRRENVSSLLTAAGTFATDGSNGRVYVKGADIDFAALTSDFEFDGYALAAGKGSFESWLDWRDARVVRATWRVDLDNLAVRGPARTVSTAGLHGIVDLHRRADGDRIDWAGRDGGDLALLLPHAGNRSDGVLAGRNIDLAPLLPGPACFRRCRPRWRAGWARAVRAAASINCARTGIPMRVCVLRTPRSPASASTRAGAFPACLR